MGRLKAYRLSTANPTSTTRTAPESSSIRLTGLMSLWTIPIACAASSPPAWITKSSAWSESLDIPAVDRSWNAAQLGEPPEWL